jgi:hypothetical protein
MSLPNPSEDFIKQIERLLYRFLWNKGPDKIKRSVIDKIIEAG